MKHRYMWLIGAAGITLGFALSHVACEGKSSTETTQEAGGTKDAAATDTATGADTATGTDTATGADQTAGTLKWYKTCGDPACGGHRPGSTPACTTQKEGDACGTKDDKCDPNNDCNAHLLCTDKDPTQQPGGCPISQRSKKHQIRYLKDRDQQRLHQAILDLRLATYRYKHQGNKGLKKYGFIIEDHPHKALLYGNGERVDLYSYLSMMTAALQVQARQIRALQKQLKATRHKAPLVCR